ncbi:MAG: hypothetical protein Q9171_004799 [Xanthocarpia ochracea]
MVEFFRDENALKSDIIAVQEPRINRYQATTHNPQKQLYNVVWPTDEIPEDTGRKVARVCMFVHKKIDPGTIQVFKHIPTCQTVVIKFCNNPRNMKLAQERVAALEKQLEELNLQEPRPLFLGSFQADANAMRIQVLTNLDEALADYGK